MNQYDGSWESLQTMPVPAWFDDGKIGIFIHWGPYSLIGYHKAGRGYAEHVPKSIEGVIHEMIEVVSRNGNFLINIGPRADGTIPEPQVERLRAMGAWLAINGDAIYGTRYWKESGQADEHLAFTTKGQTLYAIKLAKPVAPFVVAGTAGWKAGQVKSVKLLGSDSDVSWDMTPAGLRITPPVDLGASQYAWSFEIVTDEDQHTPNAIVNDASEALKNTRRVDLDGRAGQSE